jgi:hypothetical protein
MAGLHPSKLPGKASKLLILDSSGPCAHRPSSGVLSHQLLGHKIGDRRGNCPHGRAITHATAAPAWDVTKRTVRTSPKGGMRNFAWRPPNVAS